MISPLLKWAGTWGLWGQFTARGGGTIQPYLHKEKPYCGELRAVSGPEDSGRLQSSPLTGRQQIACALVGPAWWGQMAFGGAGALQDACVLTAWRQVREMQCYSVVPLLFCTFPSPCSVLNCDPSFVKDVFVWECLCGWVHPQPQFNLSSEGGKKKSDLWKKTLQHQALFINLISQAFIRRGLLSRRYVRLFNKESGCVWFKEQGDSVSIRAPPGDSPISQVKCSGGGASNKVHTISVIHHRGQIYKQQGVRSAVVWTLLKVEEESLPFSCNRMETTPQPPLDRCLDLGVINKPRSEEQRDNFFSVVQYVVRMEFNHVNVKSAHCREVCLKLLQQWFKELPAERCWRFGLNLTRSDNRERRISPSRKLHFVDFSHLKLRQMLDNNQIGQKPGWFYLDGNLNVVFISYFQRQSSTLWCEQTCIQSFIMKVMYTSIKQTQCRLEILPAAWIRCKRYMLVTSHNR